MQNIYYFLIKYCLFTLCRLVYDNKVCTFFLCINDIVEQYQSKIEFSIFSRVVFARLWYEHITLIQIFYRFNGKL